ncbi:hypothetical protein DFH09DRAFT_1108314 [Mycena vulgaris]|nr:hypothetical protein DFH09DRAFT_1108314 [Mycena vulgaris]
MPQESENAVQLLNQQFRVLRWKKSLVDVLKDQKMVQDQRMLLPEGAQGFRTMLHQMMKISGRGRRAKKTRNQASVPGSANPWTLSSSGASTSHAAGSGSVYVAQVGAPDEFDTYFGPGDISGADAAEMDRLEHEALHGPAPPEAAIHGATSTASLLKQAARRSNSHMFFSKGEVFTHDEESEDEGMESQNEDDETTPRLSFHPNAASSMEKLDDSCFFIVTWAYCCRDSCKSYFHGWSQRLLESLPAYLQLEFPAVLSRKTGLSKQVLSMLRVGNQHKMGPSGLRTMLYEMHTLRYNTLLLQYLESAFEQEHGSEGSEKGSIQTTLLHSYASARRIPTFGDFADPKCYAGFVPSVSYLTSMMNKAIEKDEPDADQHTSRLAPDHADIDDSHKVSSLFVQLLILNMKMKDHQHIANVDGVPGFGALWICMTSKYNRAQVLTLTKSHKE